MQKYINRILNINWDSIGSNTDKNLHLLDYEFIRRISKFINDNNFKPISMIRFTSVVAYLNNDFELIKYGEKIFEEYSTDIMKDKLKCSFGKYILGYYFQLIEYCIENPTAEKYLEIYEPLIKLWEIGGDINPDYHGNLEIKGVCAFPIRGYWIRFKDKPPRDISQFYK